MLDHPGAGDLAVLCDVADEDDRHALGLGQPDHLAGAGADLGDRARAGLMGVGPEGLDGIDDDDVEFLTLQRSEDVP